MYMSQILFYILRTDEPSYDLCNSFIDNLFAM